MPRTTTYATLTLLGLTILLPVVLGAPEVRDTDLATSFVTTADTFLFACPFDGAYTIRSPDGQALTIQTDGTCANVGIPAVPPCIINIGTSGTVIQWARVRLDGVHVGGSPSGWSVVLNDNLIGAPSDGTWQFSESSGTSSITSLVCLEVSGKRYQHVESTFQAFTCFWNQHITTSTYQASGAGCSGAAPDQDPAEYRFFADSPEAPNDDPNPHPFTTHSNVTCPATLVVNGVWGRGTTQTLNTFARFHVVQGDFRSDPILSDNIGVISTTLTDKGAGTDGTHSDTTLYNNAAGNSYQLAVRNGTDGPEILGAVLFASPSQCTVIPPNISGFVYDPDSFEQIVSQAQCNGDLIAFSINVELTLEGSHTVNVTIFDAITGAAVIVIPHDQMITLGSSSAEVHYFSLALPSGPWMALALLDRTGIGSADFFSSRAVNVPVGTCISAVIDFGPTNDLIRLEHNQTNSYVNLTNTTLHNDHLTQGLYPHCQNTTVQVGDCQGIHANLTEVHTHIDQHFEDMAAILADICSGGSNCTFIVNNTDVINAIEAQNMTIIELEGYTDAEVGGILLFGALLVWALWRRWWFVAGCASFGFLANVSHLPGSWTIVSLLLLFLAYWLEMWAVNSKAGDAPRDT